MLHFETIEPATLELLRNLQSFPILQECRLVGETSLALQLGHRKSVDLDLFGTLNCEPEELVESLSSLGSLEIRRNSGSIHLFILNGIHIDIINSPFEWRKPAIELDGIRLADKEDIAAMKITAVIGRGTKKDFVDVATLLDYYSLASILSFYLEKYPNGSNFMALKSLTYFDDAEQQPMPEMLSHLTWEEAKNKIREAILNI